MSEFLWTEIYRPHSLDECILPQRLKDQFRGFIQDGNVPNLILSGGPGRGKTSVARAVLDELEAPYLIENGSMTVTMDALRTDITEWAVTPGENGGRKYVILDEADFLNAHVQPALRHMIEEHAATCGFILTCNYKTRIMPELHSRCALIEFSYSKEENQALAKDIFERLQAILKEQKVKVDLKALAAVVKKYYPDMRAMINVLQAYSIRSGAVDSGILVQSSGYQDLYPMIKAKDWERMRKWVGENEPNAQLLWKSLFDDVDKYTERENIPDAIVVLGEGQKYLATVPDIQLHIVSTLIELMYAGK